jgi:hypothetical protein
MRQREVFEIGLDYRLDEQDQAYLLRIRLLVVVVLPSDIVVNELDASWWGGHRLMAAIG